MPASATESWTPEAAELATVVDRLPLGLLRTTIDGRILYVSAGAARLLGYESPDTLCRRRAEEIYARPAERPGIMADIEQASGTRVLEVELRRADATTFWARYSSTPHRDASGRVLWIDGVLEDVSVAREEADRRREMNALLSFVFDALEDAVIIVSWPERRIVRVNRACERMYQRTEAELIGQTTAVFHVDEAHYEEFGRRIGEKFARKELARVEYRMQRKDGEIFPVESTMTLLTAPDGGIVAGLALTRDITREKQQQSELDAARRESAHREKLAAMGQLVAGVAHELRTPLVYISNHAFLLQRADGRTNEHTEAIIKGVDRIDGLVEGLRRFTRAPAGDHGLADVSELAAEAVALFRATHPGGAPVHAELAAQAPVLADRAQLQQVVLNLLENAADAGGGAGAITVRVLADDGNVTMEIEDEGPGIPRGVADRMWEPFFTTKPEGTGLGLAIVRRIVESHRGNIAAENSPRGGAIFRMRLPRAAM